MKHAPGSGLVGAIGVTAINQIAKRILPEAPRLDLLGLRLVAAGFQLVGAKPPHGLPLRIVALLGDLFSNSLFFGLVGLGRRRTAPLRGAALGLVMGAGATILPEPLGLGGSPTARTRTTAGRTVLWYLLGGLLAGATYALTHPDRD